MIPRELGVLLALKIVVVRGYANMSCMVCDCKVLGSFHVFKTEKITLCSSHTLLKPKLLYLSVLLGS